MLTKEKIALFFTKEPERGLREKGILSGENTLTDIGRDLFLNYLLAKHKEDFCEFVSKQDIK